MHSYMVTIKIIFERTFVQKISKIFELFLILENFKIVLKQKFVPTLFNF